MRVNCLLFICRQRNSHNDLDSHNDHLFTSPLKVAAYDAMPFLKWGYPYAYVWVKDKNFPVLTTSVILKSVSINFFSHVIWGRCCRGVGIPETRSFSHNFKRKSE